MRQESKRPASFACVTCVTFCFIVAERSRQEIAKSFQFVADRDVCLTQDAPDPFFLPVRIRAIADRNLQINR